MKTLYKKELVNATANEEIKIVRDTETFGLSTYKTTITVADGATTGKEAAIGMPADFLPLAVMVTVTVAATNAVNLQDIGDDADTDAYVDGATIALNTTGYKGIFGCNGVRGVGTGTAGALTTADEVEVVVSGDPGATGATMELVFLGVRVA